MGRRLREVVDGEEDEKIHPRRATTVMARVNQDNEIDDRILKVVENNRVYYRCTACGYATVRTFNVARHYVRKHTKLQTPKTCPRCAQNFKTKGDFYEHRKECHDVYVPPPNKKRWPLDSVEEEPEEVDICSALRIKQEPEENDIYNAIQIKQEPAKNYYYNAIQIKENPEEINTYCVLQIKQEPISYEELDAEEELEAEEESDAEEELEAEEESDACDEIDVDRESDACDELDMKRTSESCDELDIKESIRLLNEEDLLKFEEENSLSSTCLEGSELYLGMDIIYNQEESILHDIHDDSILPSWALDKDIEDENENSHLQDDQTLKQSPNEIIFRHSFDILTDS